MKLSEVLLWFSLTAGKGSICLSIRQTYGSTLLAMHATLSSIYARMRTRVRAREVLDGWGWDEDAGLGWVDLRKEGDPLRSHLSRFASVYQRHGYLSVLHQLHPPP